MTGADIERAIATATPLINPRLSEVDWDAVAGVLTPLAPEVPPVKVDPERPWDHPYDTPADGSNVCIHCGQIGSYAHTEEAFRRYGAPEVPPRTDGLRTALLALVEPLYSTHERAVEGVDRWLNVLDVAGWTLVPRGAATPEPPDSGPERAKRIEARARKLSSRPYYGCIPAKAWRQAIEAEAGLDPDRLAHALEGPIHDYAGLDDLAAKVVAGYGAEPPDSGDAAAERIAETRAYLATERSAVIAAARLFLAAHDQVVGAKPIARDDAFAMKNAADRLRNVLRLHDDNLAQIEAVRGAAAPAEAREEGPETAKSGVDEDPGAGGTSRP